MVTAKDLKEQIASDTAEIEVIRMTLERLFEALDRKYEALSAMGAK